MVAPKIGGPVWPFISNMPITLALDLGLYKDGSRVGARSLGRGCPLPRNFFEFLSRNGAFLGILLMTGACTLDPPLGLYPLIAVQLVVQSLFT